MRVAVAPISWGICDVPGWGYQYPYAEVLSDMRDLGVAASELGPMGFLPEQAAEAGETLREFGIEPVGLYLDVVLHTEEEQWRTALLENLEYVSAAGGDTIALAALPAPHSYERRGALSEAEWGRLLRNLDEAAEIAETAGVTLAIHPHLGTLVERPDEISRVLRDSRVKLCLDTGHSLAGGADPAALIREAGDRIALVHLKDVRSEPIERMNRGEIDFLEAIAEGAFCALGDGDLPIDEILGALAAGGYGGWIVLEQDTRLPVRPERSPKDDVERSLAAVRAAWEDR